MTRQPLGAAIAVLLLLPMAGCTEDSTVPVTEPTGASQGQWRSWGGPYAAHGYGYGFIGADNDGYGPSVPVVAVDGAGHVLEFQVAMQVTGRRDPPQAAPVELEDGAEPWRAAVEEVLQPGYLFPIEEAQAFRVSQLRVATLDEATWPAVRDALADAHDRIRAPRESEECCIADGGSRVVRIGQDWVRLDDNRDDGGGWGDVEDQLLAIRDWVDPDPWA